MKDELVMQLKPKSNISEDIRTIRTNLQFTSADEESKVILITSSVPGEGKSFISSNLATAFSQTGESTLLIDCDLRLGRVHKIFGVSNDKGFSNLLVGQNIVDCADFIKKTSNQQGISATIYMKAFKSTFRNEELMTKEQMENIINLRLIYLIKIIMRLKLLMQEDVMILLLIYVKGAII